MPGLGSSPNDASHSSEESADRAKVAARESGAWLRDEAARLYTSYRGQTKYFKWRAWIVASYAAIVVASLVMAAPSMNPIDAYVVPRYDVNGEFNARVENNSAESWTNVRLVLDDRYQLAKERVPARETMLVRMSQFSALEGGSRAPADYRPYKLVVKTEQGSHKAKVGER
jgi:hypothetical protein